MGEYAFGGLRPSLQQIHQGCCRAVEGASPYGRIGLGAVLPTAVYYETTPNMIFRLRSVETAKKD
jgi:hypothetical protein